MRYRELMEKREMVYEIAARYGARNLRVFGSVARGDEIPESDIDILVDMEAGRSLLDLGGLLMELKDVFGCEVDVVTVQGLRERLRERVLKEAVPL
ncbi:MAG: nucleotidyltransferase family protein [Chloroflexi bacterium]|nr:nucleotidyltransferase family protein [Chloroflexota bacterium]